MTPANHFDSETVSLMGRVCDEAWIELQKKNFFPTPVNAQSVRSALASLVLDAEPGRTQCTALAVHRP
jgi:hypothetical protein